MVSFWERKKTPFPEGFFASFLEVCATFLGEQFVKCLFLKIFEWGFDGASKEPAQLFFYKGIGWFSFQVNPRNLQFRTHGLRTPKKPEYLIARLQLPERW